MKEAVNSAYGTVKRVTRNIIIIAVLAGLAALVLGNYSYVFSKTVHGEIIGVKRVTQPTAVLGGGALQSDALFSFAVAVKAEDGEIFTASSEDRQWAVAEVGYCVDARFFPYPPWDLKSSGTYFNARLIKLIDCNGKSAKSDAPPTPTPEPAH